MCVGALPVGAWPSSDIELMENRPAALLALVAGLIPRYREDRFGLARLTLLLPSQRAVRIVTEAFVRASGAGGRGGLLLPRMAVVGDLDLDETLGPLLDPIGAAASIPQAIEPTFRLLRLSELLREELADEAPGTAALLRQARGIADAIDRLLVEDVPVERMLDEAVIGEHDMMPASGWMSPQRMLERLDEEDEPDSDSDGAESLEGVMGVYDVGDDEYLDPFDGPTVKKRKMSVDGRYARIVLGGSGFMVGMSPVQPRDEPRVPKHMLLGQVSEKSTVPIASSTSPPPSGMAPPVEGSKTKFRIPRKPVKLFGDEERAFGGAKPGRA